MKSLLDQVKYRKTLVNPWLLSPIKGVIHLGNGDLQDVLISHCYLVGDVLHFGFAFYGCNRHSTRPASEIQISEYEKRRVEKLLEDCLGKEYQNESV